MRIMNIMFIILTKFFNFSAQHILSSDACYHTTSLRVLSHNHILSLDSTALQHLSALRPQHANVLPLRVSNKHAACTQPACMRGISPVMSLSCWEPVVAGSTFQERGGGWKSTLIHANSKWHNDEINKNTVVSLRTLEQETTITNMFLLCPRSHCNNVLLTRTGSCCEPTLFNRLFSGQVQCQRTLCTTSWYIEAQSKHSLEMRAPIHIHTESKLLLPWSDHTEVHIVPFSAEKAFYSKYREHICSLLGSKL